MSETGKNLGDPYALHPETEIAGSPGDSESDVRIADEIDSVGDASAAADATQTGPSPGWLLFRELAETIILSLVIFLLIRQVVQNYRIESHSMEPNFHEGEFILVNKLAYRLGEPERGDVIVFNNPSNTDEDYIKRVIGLPGDTVEMRNGLMYINGIGLHEDFGPNPMSNSASFPPILIEPDHLFVMGDNRPNSSDSRRFGPLDQDLIVGRAWVRVWPIAGWDVIDHGVIEPEVVSAQSQ